MYHGKEILCSRVTYIFSMNEIANWLVYDITDQLNENLLFT